MRNGHLMTVLRVPMTMAVQLSISKTFSAKTLAHGHVTGGVELKVGGTVIMTLLLPKKFPWHMILDGVSESTQSNSLQTASRHSGASLRGRLNTGYTCCRLYKMAFNSRPVCGRT